MFGAGKQLLKILRNLLVAGRSWGKQGGLVGRGHSTSCSTSLCFSSLVWNDDDSSWLLWALLRDMTASLKSRPMKGKFCFHCCHCYEILLMLFLLLEAGPKGPYLCEQKSLTRLCDLHTLRCHPMVKSWGGHKSVLVSGPMGKDCLGNLRLIPALWLWLSFFSLPSSPSVQSGY